MKVIKQVKGIRVTATGYHASVPALYKPRIKGIKTIEGERFYVDTDGKLYKPHLFDAMFKTVRGKVQHYTYKGENPNLRLREG